MGVRFSRACLSKLDGRPPRARRASHALPAYGRSSLPPCAAATAADAAACRRARGGVALGRRSSAAAARFSARASNSAAGALWVPSLARSLPLPRRSRSSRRRLSLGQLRRALAAKLGTADARLKEVKRVPVLLKGAMLAAHGRAIERQAAAADEATHAQHGELVEHAVRVTPHAFATPEWIAEFLATAAATSTAVTLDDNTGRRQLYLRGGRDRATKAQCALLREKAQAEERASGAAGEFDKWLERVLEVQLHEMTALGPGDVCLDDDVLMLVGGRFVQPPHADLEDGQRQSFGNVGDASPALVHTGDRPTFESATLQRGIDVRRATAADASSLERLRANLEMLSPRSELQLAMWPAISQNVVTTASGAVRNPAGTVTSLGARRVHAGNWQRAEIRSELPRIVIFDTASPTGRSGYLADVQVQPWRFAELDCMSEACRTTLGGGINSHNTMSHLGVVRHRVDAGRRLARDDLRDKVAHEREVLLLQPLLRERERLGGDVEHRRRRDAEEEAVEERQLDGNLHRRRGRLDPDEPQHRSRLVRQHREPVGRATDDV